MCASDAMLRVCCTLVHRHRPMRFCDATNDCSPTDTVSLQIRIRVVEWIWTNKRRRHYAFHLFTGIFLRTVRQSDNENMNHWQTKHLSSAAVENECSSKYWLFNGVNDGQTSYSPSSDSEVDWLCVVPQLYVPYILCLCVNGVCSLQ